MNANFEALASKIEQLQKEINELKNKGTKRQFVGITSQTHNREDGVIVMNKSCNEDYPGSTICSSEDIFNSYDDKNATGYAWIKAVYQPIAVAKDTGGYITKTLGASGVTGGFGGGLSGGMLSVNLPGGKMSSGGSDQAVACCK